MEVIQDNKTSDVVNKEGQEVGNKKRGRKKTKEKPQLKDQKKFFIDYSKDKKGHEKLVNLMDDFNTNELGREVTIQDLVDYALAKITSKDLEAIKEKTLGEMDKVRLLLEKYNLKHGTNLDLGEFLVKQLKI